MRLAVAVGILCASVALTAQRIAGDLWVGVLVLDVGPDGHVAAESGTEFQPVGALVDGAWHFEVVEDTDAIVRLHQTYGQVPARWLPLGRALPSRWRGWLTDGRVERFEIAGPFRLRERSDDYRIAARLRSPRVATNRYFSDGSVAGIAVSGDAQVYPFLPFGDRDADDDREDVPPEPIRAAMLNAEVRTIATTLLHLEPGEEFKRSLAEVTIDRLRDARYSYTTWREAALPDGRRMTAFEGSKPLGFSQGCTHAHGGGAMATSKDGVSTVLGTWTYLVCDELHIDHIPLAVIERGGRACWVTKYQYEDGIQFALMPPGVVDDYLPQQRCDIR